MAGSYARPNLPSSTGSRAIAHQVVPVLVAQIAERGIDLAHIFFDLIDRVESRILTHISADTLERDKRNERPNIVDDEAPDRCIRLRRQQHADDAAHRRADPIDLFAAGARNKRRHVGKILRVVVIDGTGEPVAAAAAGDVGTEDLPVSLKRARKIIEIAPVSREAMRADDRRLRGRTAPFGIGDAMKAAEASTVKLSFLHAVSMKKGRIVNYHGRGQKKTAKIAAQIRAPVAHLHVVLATH